MSNSLVIVESPAKSKTLESYLGKDFKVLASYGHVRDLLPKKGAVDPDNNFAMIYEAIERNEKAVNAIKKALKKADTFYYSGFARNNLGKHKEAIPYFKKALILKPFKAGYHFDLGNSYKHLKLYDNALYHFRKTLEIEPNHYKALNNMGTIFWA